MGGVGKMTNKNVKIIIMLLAILIVMNSLILSSVGNLRNDIANLKNDTRSVSSRINSMEITIDNLYAEKKMIQNVNVEIENIEDEYKDANISINVVFNEIGTGSKAYLMYREKAIYEKDYFIEDYNDKPNIEKNEWNRVEMVSQNDLEFIGTFRGTYESDYELQIIVEDNSVKKIEKMSDVDLYSKLRGRFNIDIDVNEMSSDGKIDYDVRIGEFNSNDKTKLISAESTLYYKDKIIETVDIMKESTNDGIRMEQAINEWHYVNVQFDVQDNSETIFEDIRIKVVVKDALGNTYYKHWRMH